MADGDDSKKERGSGDQVRDTRKGADEWNQNGTSRKPRRQQGYAVLRNEAVLAAPRPWPPVATDGGRGIGPWQSPTLRSCSPRCNTDSGLMLLHAFYTPDSSTLSPFIFSESAVSWFIGGCVRRVVWNAFVGYTSDKIDGYGTVYKPLAPSRFDSVARADTESQTVFFLTGVPRAPTSMRACICGGRYTQMSFRIRKLSRFSYSPAGINQLTQSIRPAIVCRCSHGLCGSYTLFECASNSLLGAI